MLFNIVFVSYVGTTIEKIKTIDNETAEVVIVDFDFPGKNTPAQIRFVVTDSEIYYVSESEEVVHVANVGSNKVSIIAANQEDFFRQYSLDLLQKNAF